MKNRKEIIQEVLKADDKKFIIWTSHPEAIERGKNLTEDEVEQYRKQGVLAFLMRIGEGGAPVLLNEFKIQYFASSHQLTNENKTEL